MRAKAPEPIVNALVESAGDSELKVRQQIIGSLARMPHSTPAKVRVLTKAEKDEDVLIRSIAAVWRQGQ